MSKPQIVLLPFATPHSFFKKGGVFHPAALPMQVEKRPKDFNETVSYTSYSAVKLAGSISTMVVATIPSKTTVAGMALDQLLSGFIDPVNILAEVERIEHDGDSIASQVTAGFNAYQGIDKLVLIWPYQMFDHEKPMAFTGEVTMGHTHPMLSINKDHIPECVVFSVTDETEKDQTQCTVKNVMKLSDVDTMIKGSFTRVISVVDIMRDEWNVWQQTAQDPEDISEFLAKTLPGTQAGLVNPDGNQFI